VPTIEVGAGVTVELSAEWLSLARIEVPLVNAWGQYREAIAATGKWWLFETSWDLLLLRLWRDDKIELAARHRDPEARIEPVRLPVSERISHLFDPPDLYSRLFYRPTELMLFDVHVRAVGEPAPPPTERAPQPVTRKSITAERRPGKMVRRVQLVYDNEVRAEWPSTTAKAALQAALVAAQAREDLQAIAVLRADITHTPVFEMWRAVQELRKDPQASITEILQKLRAAKTAN
jgi:hypothetical protein